jgi:hypothetical protein
LVETAHILPNSTPFIQKLPLILVGWTGKSLKVKGGPTPRLMLVENARLQPASA